VDLDSYAPLPRGEIPSFSPYRLLVVEGSLAGGLDAGLKAAVRLAESLSKQFTVELNITGKVDERIKSRLEKGNKRTVNFLGMVPREQIPDLMRSSHLLFSAEINPPCPNSVIEALACGLPVVGFDTGSLYELIGEGAGRLVPYGGDPWKLEPPDVPALTRAAAEILVGQESFRSAARARAEEFLSLDKMVDEYLKVLLDNYH
jgi:glycosyltransferase involved in cell wall biosynthesis